MIENLLRLRLSLRWTFSAFLVCLLQACGSGNDVFSYQPGTGSLYIDQPAIATMTQANSVTLSVVTDGSGTRVLSMLTPATVLQPVGAFVGGGRGNKGILELAGFDGLKLSDVGAVELDAKLVSGSVGNFYMNFLVDLDCVKNEDLNTMTIADLRVNRRIIVWIPGAGTAQPDGYTRYSVTATDSAWLIVGSPTYGMGQNPSGPATVLGLAGYPNACIIDGVSVDGGLPRNTSIPACVTGAALPTTASAACGMPHKGALVLLGDSNSLEQKEWLVKRLKIKERVVLFR